MSSPRSSESTWTSPIRARASTSQECVSKVMMLPSIAAGGCRRGSGRGLVAKAHGRSIQAIAQQKRIQSHGNELGAQVKAFARALLVHHQNARRLAACADAADGVVDGLVHGGGGRPGRGGRGGPAKRPGRGEG